MTSALGIIPPLLAVGVLLMGSQPALAQTIAISVVAREDSQPVVGALAHLVNGTGAIVDKALTDASGRALFMGVDKGEYHVRVEMIGMTSATSSIVAVAEGLRTVVIIRLEFRPIGIRGLDVVSGERCRVRPAGGLLAADLWAEARKALTLAVYTGERHVYTFETRMYERDLDREGRVLRREVLSEREAAMRTPFVSRPPEELMATGFVQSEWYFAPDAKLLLSDAFLDSHCFVMRLSDREETSGLVGLAFEPLGRRGRTVDIAGTLWIDPETSELRWLEFRYTNLDPDVAHDDVGGRVYFRRMPQGSWIVPEWWIRMPTIARQRDADGRSRRYVAGFRQVGGVVLEVRERSGTALTGSIAGIVVDSLGYLLRDARIGLVGSDREVISDADGRFRITGLSAGVYEVRATTDALEALGHSADIVMQEVRLGAVARVKLFMPSASAALSRICDAQLAKSGRDAGPRGIVHGWVRDLGSGRSVSDALVRVEWLENVSLDVPERSRPQIGIAASDSLKAPRPVMRGGYLRGYEVISDEKGYYRVCGVPEVDAISVIATVDDVRSVNGTVSIPVLGGVVQHTMNVWLRSSLRDAALEVTLYRQGLSGSPTGTPASVLRVGEEINAEIDLGGAVPELATVSSFWVTVTGPAPLRRPGRQILTEEEVSLEPALLVIPGTSSRLRWRFGVTEDMANLAGPFELRIDIPEFGLSGSTSFVVVH